MKHLLKAVARSLAPASARDEGFGLIEVLVGAVIVVALGAAVAQALIVGAITSTDQRKRAQAAQVSQQDQERLRGFSDSQLNDLSTPQVRTVGPFNGTSFTVTSSAQFISSTGGSTCGASGSGAAAYYDISSTTTWTGNRRAAVVSRSLITPPAGGTLLTQIHDQNTLPLSGVAVTANGPAPLTGGGNGPVAASDTTDVNGCTVFPALLSGTYSLTVADAGFVDPNGNPSPLTIPAVVTSVGTAGPSSGNPLVLGQAGLINANFNTNWSVLPASNLTGQFTDGISWLGAGTSNSMSAYKSNPSPPAGTLVSTVPISGTIALFPFSFNPLTVPSYTNNYTVWAGGCQQMEPPTGVDQFSVAPGSNQTLAVQEPAINLQVSSNTTTPVRVQPAHVRLTYTSATGPACTDTWTPTIATGATPTNGSLQYPGQPFVTTATSGGTASVSGFTGTLTVCADFKTGGNWHTYTTPAITNTNFAAATLVAFTIPTTGATAQCP